MSRPGSWSCLDGTSVAAAVAKVGQRLASSTVGVGALRKCAAAPWWSEADDAIEVRQEIWEPGQLARLTTKHRHPVQQEVVEATAGRSTGTSYPPAPTSSTDTCSGSRVLSDKPWCWP